jgi:hypothetical protein
MSTLSGQHIFPPFLAIPRVMPHLESERARDGMKLTSLPPLEFVMSFAYRSGTRSVPAPHSTLQSSALLPKSAQHERWFLLPWLASAAPRSPSCSVAGGVHLGYLDASFTIPCDSFPRRNVSTYSGRAGNPSSCPDQSAVQRDPPDLLPQQKQANPAREADGYEQPIPSLGE